MNYKFKHIKSLFILIPLFTIGSCDNTLFNPGDTITKEIEITDFREIYFNSIFDVYFHQDTIDQIFATGGSNLIPNLEFKIDEDKILSIDDLNTAQWSRNYEKIKLDIHVDTLWYLQLNSPVKISCIDTLRTPELKLFALADYSDIDIKLKCGNCYIVNSGTSGGIITIAGSTNSFSFRSRGSLIFNAENFKAGVATARNESIGDCRTYVTKALSVEVLNSGNILYKGNPDTIIYLNDRAKNQLIKID